MEFYGIVWFWGVYEHLFGVTWGVGAQVGTNFVSCGRIRETTEGTEGHREWMHWQLCVPLCPLWFNYLVLMYEKFDTNQFDQIKEIVEKGFEATICDV